MKFVMYEAADGAQAGLVSGDQVLPLQAGARLQDLLGDDGTRIRGEGERAASGAYGGPVDLVGLKLLAPVGEPPTIRDFYAFEQHVATARRNRGLDMEPDWYELPVFYFSNPYAVVGPDESVPSAPGSERLDFELEVAAVIGMGGSNLTPTEAEGQIAGFTIMNDWSARDVQMREMRLSMGPVKGKDFATSLGPLFVTPDEIADSAKGKAFDLTMTASVNGREYSRACLADIWWSFEEMISYASRGTRVAPGDVIGSGTCGTGCILELSLTHGSEAYPWLEPGDVVELSVDRLGTLRNTVAPALPYHPLRRGAGMSKAEISPFADLLGRLELVEIGLRRSASRRQPGGLTDPDPRTEERWEGGQVWAHLAEFCPYWISEIRKVIAGAGDEPVQFGRVKGDPGRIAAIAEHRDEAVGVLAARTAAGVRQLREYLREVDRGEGAWERVGVHPKLGPMTVTEMVEEFLVGHLEEHLRQLDALAAAAAASEQGHDAGGS